LTFLKIGGKCKSLGNPSPRKVDLETAVKPHLVADIKGAFTTREKEQTSGECSSKERRRQGRGRRHRSNDMIDLSGERR